MKVRIKFTKTGPLKFIGHLDMMRYFQKAFRRANVDIAYSKGYSPHQLISFAAPLGIGLTSEAEYLDAEFNSTKSSQEMIDIINTVMADGIEILEFNQLEDKAKNAMASVAGADYLVSFRENYYDTTLFLERIVEFFDQEEINVIKKTKKSEKEVNIKPMIYEIRREYDQIFMKLSTGSVANLKPETVMEAFCLFLQLEYQKTAFMVHRTETYLQTDPEDVSTLLPLGAAGKPIE